MGTRLEKIVRGMSIQNLRFREMPFYYILFEMKKPVNLSPTCCALHRSKY